MNKDTIRPIYAELQGYLSQAPKLESVYTTDETLWESLNVCVDELNTLTSKDYSKFKIKPKHREEQPGWESYSEMDISSYRNKLSGLINKLHAEYFSDENAPFSGTPTSVFSVSQNQNQSQQQSIQITLFQINERIDSAIKADATSPSEKSFLESLKAQLPFITSVFQLMQLVIKLANENSIHLKRLYELLFHS